MSHVDQFESFFRAATKERFHRVDVQIRQILTVTDLPEAETRALADRIRAYLPPALGGARWELLPGSATTTVAGLLEEVETRAPDLVCTYRNLHTDTWRWPYSLGEHLDVLTQVSTVPVLVLPHPQEAAAWGPDGHTRDVMAITDHMTGDDALVSWAAACTTPGGTLHLAHVEDEDAFERTIDVIGKIPALDTDVAREEIRRQLLKEPQDYIDSCQAALAAAGAPITVTSAVAMGHRLGAYRGLIEAHRVDLLVLNTKDDDQLAMHGLAHPLAVELRRTPLLML